MHAPDHAAADAFPKRLGFNPGLDAKRESFGNRLSDGAVDHLMDEFTNTAATQRTGVQDLIAEGAQNRLDPLEDFLFAADHNLMNAPRRARLTGGDRSIEHESAFGTEEGFEPADERRRACRDIDVDGTRSYPFQNSIGAARNLLDILGHR